MNGEIRCEAKIPCFVSFLSTWPVPEYLGTGPRSNFWCLRLNKRDGLRCATLAKAGGPGSVGIPMQKSPCVRGYPMMTGCPGFSSRDNTP